MGERQMRTGENTWWQPLVVSSFAFAVSSCQTTSSVEATVSTGSGLTGTEWRLAELVSMDDAIGTVRPADPSRYTLLLGQNGIAHLRLDCNRGNGPWSSTAPPKSRSGAFTIGPAAMTRAMCPPGSLDQRIARELQFVRSFTIKGDRLTLGLQADGGLQVWEASKGAAE
jgi:heat shock protein HslJ